MPSLLQRRLAVVASPSALIGTLLVLAACTRAVQPLERYRLTPVLPGAAGAARGGAAGAEVRPTSGPKKTRRPCTTLRVEPYVAEGLYAGPRIVHRTGESEYDAYPNRQWARPLSTMLADITGEAVRSVARGRVRVTGMTDGADAEYIWRGAVRQFEEVSRGEQVLVAVHLEGALLRARDDSLLWQGDARGERPVAADSMPAVVAALSALGTETVTTLLRDAAEAVLPP